MALSKKLQKLVAEGADLKKDPAYLLGVEEGRRQATVEALRALQPDFMAPDVSRHTPKGQAILEVVAKLSNHMKNVKWPE